MSKISIIVPVYKVEKYLERCVQSLQNQKIQDIEIILVDDGSPDSCGEICDQMAASDQRIKVVHKQNGGLSSARNAGLKKATGKYIGFIDSDDDVEADMFDKMVNAAEHYQVDFVMADYQRVMEDGTSYIVSKNIRGGLYKKENIREEIFPNLIMSENVDYGPLLSVWHCIYRHEFLKKNSICFADDVKWSEDNLFSSLVGYCADSFYYLKGEALYHYHQNPGTITTSYRSGAWAVYRRMNEYLAQYFSDRPDFDFSRQLQLHLLYYACNTLGMECANAKSVQDVIKRTKGILKDPALRKAMRHFSLPAVDIKLKIQIFFIKMGLSLPVVMIMRR